jgi:hypothetical protein
VNLLERIFNALEEAEIENNTHKINNPILAKNKHKNAWQELKKIVYKVGGTIRDNIYIKPSQWSMGQYLYKSFWFELKTIERKDSSSSVSLSVNKDKVKIYLEWDRKNAEKSSNTLEEHNQWINYINVWCSKSNINLDNYFVWVTNEEDKDKPEPISLRSFILDKEEYNKQILQQRRNPKYSFRVGVILSKEEVLKINNFEQYFKNRAKELFTIYDYTAAVKSVTSKNLSETSMENDKDYKANIQREIESFVSSITEDIEITETEKEQVVKSRIGQSAFKKALLNVEKKCSLCGVSDERFLIASHIKPWSQSNHQERLDFNNGLLLCPNHDALFDKGLISFKDDGTILISSSLDDNSIIFLNIHKNIKIEMNHIKRQYMKWHRENKFQP